MPASIFDEIIQPIIYEGNLSAWTAEVIQTRILEAHGQKISIQTIRRRQEQLGITKEKKNYSSDDLAPALKTHHEESLPQKRMLLDLSNQKGLEISKSTLVRHLCELGLTQRKDDVDNGKVSIEEAVDKVTQLQLRFGKQLGVKGMKQKLMTEFGVHLHQ